MPKSASRAAVAGPMAARRRPAMARASRPSAAIAPKRASTPLVLVRTIQSKSARFRAAARSGPESCGGSMRIEGASIVSAPSSSSRATRSEAWARLRVTMIRRPKSGRRSNHANRSRSRTTSPMRIRAGGARPASVAREGSVPRVPVTTRCRAVVPHWMTAAGVSASTSCAMRFSAITARLATPM